MPTIEGVLNKEGKVAYDVQQMTKEDIGKLPKNTSVGAKYFKDFYDSLVDGIIKYNTGINDNITKSIMIPLNSIIKKIGEETESIKSELNALKEDMPVVLGSEPFHVTGEENGLF